MEDKQLLVAVECLLTNMEEIIFVEKSLLATIGLMAD